MAQDFLRDMFALQPEDDAGERPTSHTWNLFELRGGILTKYMRLRAPDGSEFWYINDALHRTDGPAVTHADGRVEYWENGVRK